MHHRRRAIIAQRRIDAVIFDIGGVLLHLGEAAYRGEVARRLGLTALGPIYEEKFHALQRGELAEEAVWAAVAGRPVDVQSFDDAWLSNFPPLPAMLELAAEMRALGLRTAILSNTQSSHVRMMRTMGFLAGFDPVVLSCEAGCRKPEPAAFECVLSRLGLPAERVAFIDDFPECIAGAQAAGIHTILHTGDAGATRRALLELING